jgi:hypothetical protein
MKKIILMILALTLVLATIVIALPKVKADPGPVKFKIRDMTDQDSIYAGKPPPGPVPPVPNLMVAVIIESPYSWLGDTVNGIVAYTVSVRFDPRALTAFDIAAPGTTDYDLDTFPDGLLEQYAFFFTGASTISAPAGLSTATGAMYSFANAIVGIDPSVDGGAGGNPFYGAYGGMPPYYSADEALACILRFRTKSASIASVFEFMGPGETVTPVDTAIVVSCRYTTADGNTYEVPEIDLEDGYYVAETPNTMFLDSMAAYDTAAPVGSDWHELYTTYSQEWELTAWTDDGNGVLSAADVIGTRQTSGASPGTVMTGPVDWVNPSPIANDGLTDMIATLIPAEPEFPLGIGILMSLVALVPIVYVWRTRPKKKVE